MDTFKLADEVRAENHGEGWDAATETAIPAEVVETATPDAAPVEETPTPEAPEVTPDVPVETQVETSNTVTE